MREYCGDIVNFKTYSKSFKNKSRCKSKPEDILVFEDVNEPIIERSEWQRVQALRSNVRKKTATRKRNIFSGLLRCADCGSTLHFHVQVENANNSYYRCPANNTVRRSCPSTHTVRADFLEQVVLHDIRRITRYALQDTEGLASTLRNSVEQDSSIGEGILQEKLNRLVARDNELDCLYEQVYEDKVLGNLTEERFVKLSAKYEDEQSEVAAQIDAIKAQIDESKRRDNSVESFLAVIRKNSNIKKLTAALLREFVDEIHIHQAEKRDGRWHQQIDIYYNCVGLVRLPEHEATAVKPLEMKTRKGVVLTYAPTPAPDIALAPA
jgi:hypothetical protein